MPKFLNLIQYVDDGTQWTDNPNNNESGLRTIKLSQHKDPGTTIMRDSSGRAEISDPVGDYDIANKGYVTSFAVSYSTTQSLSNDSKQKARENIGAAKAADSGEYVTTGKSTDIATTVDQTIYTGKIFKGNNTFSGDVKYTGLVTADDNIVNKKYVDDNIATGQSNLNLGNGSGQGSLLQKNVKHSSEPFEPYTNVASGPASIALGKNTKALGNTDFVIGQNNEANASGSFVGGINCKNTDNSNYSIVFGDNVSNQVATKSVVMGSDIQNSAGNSIILGSDITNPLKNSFLIGRGLRSQDYISPYNDNAEYGITILGRYNKRATQGEDSDGTSFIIGDGTSDANRHNAIKLSDVNGLECFIEPKTDNGVVRKTDLDSETMDLRLVSNSIRRAAVFSAVIGASPMSRLAASETIKTITTKQAIVFHSFPTNGGGRITITVPSGYERSDASSLENIIVTSDLFIMSKIGKSLLETRYEYLVCTESDVVSLSGTTDETLSIQIINPTEWLSETINLKKTL